MTYFKDLKDGIKTTLSGLRLTLKHFKAAKVSKKHVFIDQEAYYSQNDGIVTLQYPHQKLQIPEIGRYQLDCEIDDCIVCDKCAKICPVDCIEIDAIRSPEVINYASDGSPIRLYAAKFNIDMAKCCFCGLCTTVCPTECLTMTGEYDFTVSKVDALNFAYAKLSEEEAQEKRNLFDQYLVEKEAAKVQKETVISEPKTGGFKPSFKPSFKKAEPKTEIQEEIIEEVKPKPAFKPTFKKAEPKTEIQEEIIEEIKPKTAFRPTFKKAELKAEVQEEIVEEVKPKPVFKPTFKKAEPKVEIQEEIIEEIKPKPAFKPTFKKAEPKAEIQDENIVDVSSKPELKAENQEEIKPKPVFKPSFKRPNS
jgi:formate hydrogenlyase subunit 6/NADH:ubiquinone oxidoreductase subunit I